tara:strand:- start:267 stop:434 length:168 start_codon:yes stop_codon:yes gene_type:complete
MKYLNKCLKIKRKIIRNCDKAADLACDAFMGASIASLIYLIVIKNAIRRNECESD